MTFIAAGVSPAGAADCNGNGIEDRQEIESGAADDCDGNNVPDSCEVPPRGLTFLTPARYQVGPNPTAQVVTDLDGDGSADVAVVHGRANEIHLLLNRGDGSLRPPASLRLDDLSPDSFARSLVAGDFDLDGDPDLAVPAGSRGDVILFQNGGAADFVTRRIGFVGSDGLNLQTADMDGDGSHDLVSVRSAQDQVLVFLNREGFSRPEVLVHRVEAGLGSYQLGDLDGDGDIDVALGALDLLRTVLNSGNGQFTSEVGCAVNGIPREFLLGDIDGDGDLDALNPSTVFLNDGSGALCPHASLGLFASAHALADLDGDGGLDLLLTSQNMIDGPGFLSLHRNRGDGSFFPGEKRAVPGGVLSMRLADLDRDSDPDLVLTVDGGPCCPFPPGSLIVYQNLGVGRFDAPEFAQDPSTIERNQLEARDVVGGDLNGDGVEDLAFVTYWSGELAVQLRDEEGGFREAARLTVRDTITAIARGDLDGDGDLDLAAALYFVDEAALFFNGGDGASWEATRFPSALSPICVAIADLDGDGSQDLITSSLPAAAAQVLLGSGAGVFSRLQDLDLDLAPGIFGASDLDGDGLADLLVSPGLVNAPLVLFRNRGRLVFSAGESAVEALEPRHLELRDLDQDGDLDLAATTREDIYFFLNDGQGLFHALMTLGTPSLLAPLTAASFLGLDRQPGLVVLYQNGLVPVMIPLHERPALVPDCNGDGRLDVCEIVEGLAADCDGNGIPDGCQPDCNENGIADVCDLLQGPSRDEDQNRIPDECEPDCNRNTIPDSLDLERGLERDCQGNGIPDSCEIASGRSIDCNGDGIPDECTLAPEDCNHDGVPDLCQLARGELIDCNRNGTPDECELAPAMQFAAESNFPGSGDPQSVIASDLDRDGDLDLAVSGQLDGVVALLVNQGDGSFHPGQRIEVVTHNDPPGSKQTRPRGVLALNLDGGYGLDLLTVNAGRFSGNGLQGTVTTFTSSRTGTYSSSGTLLAGLHPTAVASGDFDLDRIADLVVANRAGGDLSFFKGRSLGTFSEPISLPVGPSPTSLAVVDLDGDGFPDLAIANGSPGAITLLLTSRQGPRPWKVFAEKERKIVQVAAGDFDGDARMDLAAADGLSGEVLIFSNRGGGAFDETVVKVGPFRGDALVAADLDGDQEVDLAEGVDAGRVVVLINQGGGRFTGRLEIPLEGEPRAMAAADLNNDGLLDLISANLPSGAVSVLLNRSLPPSADDCNLNRVIDSCDLESGLLHDRRGVNGVPDECEPPPAFHRGDPNGDGQMDISDGLCLLEVLFLQASGLACRESADANNDGMLDCSDAVTILAFLFLGGSPPPAPGPPAVPCGPDLDTPGSPGDLGCDLYGPCALPAAPL